MPRIALTTEQFIAKAKKVHGDRYDYSKVDYKSSNKKVIIICQIHGEFLQTPWNHLKCGGCPKCKRVLRKDTKTFISEAKEIHGDKYDYSLVEYVRSDKKVKIICPEHGVFEQTPNQHLAGRGCFLCRRPPALFERPTCSIVYIMVDDLDHPEKMKIGITSEGWEKQRFRQLKQKTPFNVEVLATFYVGEGKAQEIEDQLHHLLKDLNCKFRGFCGCTEWFYYDSKVEKVLRTLSGIITARSYISDLELQERDLRIIEQHLKAEQAAEELNLD